MISRHISIEEEYVDKLQYYLDRNNGNIAAAIKEVINQAEKFNPYNTSTIDISLLNWMLEQIDGMLVPESVLDELINPDFVKSMEGLEKYINNRFNNLNWDIRALLKADKDIFPSHISIELRGTPKKIKFLSMIISQYLIKNFLKTSPLVIDSISNHGEYIKIKFSKIEKEIERGKEIEIECLENLYKFFGDVDKTLKVIKNEPNFWKDLIKEHYLTNYSMVTVHRNYFEDLLSGNIPLGEIMIEILAKKPVSDIPKEEMLPLIKQVYETARVVDNVDIIDSGNKIILYHNYRTKEAAEKLKTILIMLLDTNGHLYDGQLSSNMIILRHRPDVGIKINEIVNSLKTSNSPIDKELTMFATFLSGLSEMPDIPSSYAILGRRMGKSLMQEYKIENNITVWKLGDFKKALETIDTRLHRKSEFSLEKGLLKYTITSCSIAMTKNNKFHPYLCSTMRETFKGALNYVFGDRVDLEFTKSLSRGDNLCEVILRTRQTN